MATSQHDAWPDLPFAAWRGSKEALHLFLQIIGKLRLACAPFVNHWWHVTFHLHVHGLTTRPFSCGGRTIEIRFDLIAHRLIIETDDGDISGFHYVGLSVAEFYANVTKSLAALDLDVPILARPYDTFTDIPFAQDQTHRLDHPHEVAKFGQVLRTIWPIFESFRGQFKGKSSPVHVFWHSFDLALTRFSGRAAPLTSGPAVAREAYSHEAISVGFWAGDEQFPDAAFYSYTYPDPAGLGDEPLLPAQAFWDTSRGSHLALLYYRDVRAQADPAATLLTFLESAYAAGARRAAWPTPS